jgi:hypothetical protein
MTRYGTTLVAAFLVQLEPMIVAWVKGQLLAKGGTR